MFVFITVFMLCLSLSLWGILCIQDCSSGSSDNHVGCSRAGLFNRGNSGDIQTRVRGPSINLTGWRSCQEYERMLWSMLLSGRVSRCAQTATVPPSTTSALGPGWTAGLRPSLRLCLEPQGGCVRHSSDQLGPEPERGERGRHYSPRLPSDCLPRRSLRKSV